MESHRLVCWRRFLKKDPEPISASHPMTPPALEHVIQRAMEKNPEDRCRAQLTFAEN